MLGSLLVETSVDVRLNDNLLNHAQITCRIGPEAPRADRHRERLPAELTPELKQALARSDLRQGAAGGVIPRLRVLMADDPSMRGLQRALTEQRRGVTDGTVTMQAGRALLRLGTDELEVMWRLCEHLHAAHYESYWASRKLALNKLAEDVEDPLRGAEFPRKLTQLTGREPSHADIQVYLLDSDALISYSGGGERICITSALLTRFERFMYLFAHECARLYLQNPPWWEVEPCASACQGLPDQVIEAVEACAAQYLAATLSLRYGHDTGFWAVHPQVEEVFASRWPDYIAAPGKGIDLLLERMLHELRNVDSGVTSIRPRRLAVTYDGAGVPVRCAVADERF
ncbi:MAG: hypothetical protein JSV65_17425 [Armatimonadota bacterium]|nr:MAG: hypothetical protein JSV65_17425 [Armatimonadota bacterium]